MRKWQHQQLAKGRWRQLSLLEQMANIGSEIERTISWKKRGNKDYSQQAFFRALELIDLTILDPKNKPRLKEITRTREALVDHFAFANQYHSTDKKWQKYFHYFLLASCFNNSR